MTAYILYSLETGQRQWMVILGGVVDTTENGAYELKKHLNKMVGLENGFVVLNANHAPRIVSDSGQKYGIEIVPIVFGTVIDLRVIRNRS